MDMSPQRPAASGWLKQLPSHILKWWPVKMVGTAGGMMVFFIAYFWVLNHPVNPITIMPLTAIDGMIGFQPWALPLYLSLWVYVSLAPALLIDRRELMAYGLSATGLSVIGLGIFIFWPTAVPVPAVDWSFYPQFGFLKAVDATGNACPSLHVAFAVFSACWFERILRPIGAGRWARTLNWLWCLGIVYSTLAIRQHVFLDVVAGTGLGALVATVTLRSLRPV